MMMSSESFYEENLKGRSTEEISAQIDGLRREIAELKAALRSPDHYSEPQIMPSKDVQLAMALDYFDIAKTAFIAAGGKFSPTDDEKKAIKFDSKLDSLTEINLTIESFFEGAKTFTATVSGNRVVVTRKPFLQPDNEQKQSYEYEKSAFIASLRALHIGDWDCEYSCPTVLDGEQWRLSLKFSDGAEAEFRGQNAYPFSYNALCSLMCVWGKD